MSSYHVIDVPHWLDTLESKLIEFSIVDKDNHEDSWVETWKERMMKIGKHKFKEELDHFALNDN